MNRPSWYQTDVKYYDAKSNKTLVSEPDDRPSNLPKSAKFVDTNIKGRRVLGYEQRDPTTGSAIYYDLNGKEMFRYQKKGK